MTFDANYYNQIWGTVHRHDYCPDLASRLVSKYGKVRILDIGTGCGYLVKCLRDLGADAWSLEISDYAIQNSDVPQFVRKGDIRNIPWAADSFDVVHSQGVWGYFPKEDIQKAWKECKRVGKIQEHNIDCLDNDPTHQYLFTETYQWWKNQFYPKVLVACSNHESKEYAFQRWIDNIKSLTYPNYDVLVVDTSDTLDFMRRWENKVPMIHIDILGGAVKKLNFGMETIRKYFLNGDYERWLNIEADNIPPKDIIEQMFSWDHETDWLSHAYPLRNENQDIEVEQGIGCSMFTKKLMEDFNFEDADDNFPSDSWLWSRVQPLRKYKVMEIWHYLKVGHLGEKE